MSVCAVCVCVSSHASLSLLAHRDRRLRGAAEGLLEVLAHLRLRRTKRDRPGDYPPICGHHEQLALSADAGLERRRARDHLAWARRAARRCLRAPAADLDDLG